MNTTFRTALTGCILTVLAGCAATHNKIEHKPNHAQMHTHHHEHGDAHHHWDYTNHDAWGDAEVNRLCKAGQAQSPININTVTVANNQKFELVDHYTAQDFIIKNNGHTIVFDAKNPNQHSLTINGTPYSLLQFHYHLPSEHMVMNNHYPLEIHFVHKNENNGLAVVGVLVDKGQTNPHLTKVLTNLPSLGSDNYNLNDFNVKDLMPKNSKTYAYEGSLTTPPCDEHVQWLLKAEPIQASVQQLQILSALYDGNNRPVQKQGDRTVYVVE